MNRFEGRTVLVAGGTGALGRAVVLAFLEEGATVVAVARQAAKEGASLQEAAGPAADRLRVVQADVAEAAGAERAVAAAQESGRLSAVVNAVGGWSGAPIVSEEAGQLQRMLSLNLLPGYHLLRAALPALAAGADGAFVEILSLAAIGAQPGQAAYAASKAAALSLVLSVAEEWRAKGVRVNAVLPGTMDTAANRHAMPGADTSGWISTEEVARVVLFLCSDEARAVSGAAVPARKG